MSESDSYRQMEEQKAILKFFRLFSAEEQSWDSIQGDNESSFDVRKNGSKSHGDAPGNGGDSLSYVILPREGERITSNSVGHMHGREAGNDSDMTEEERNHANLTEQHSKAANTGNAPESFQVNGRSDGGCRTSLDEKALRESLQAEWASTDGADRRCDCAAQVDVKHDANEGSADSVVVCDPEKSATSTSSKAKRVVITVTRTRPGVEEYVAPTVMPPLEHSGGSSCSKNDGEEGTGAMEDSDREERDGPPGPHPDASPNNLLTFPPPGSTITRATFSPGSPTDKQIQLPPLFSALRVLRKRAVGKEHDTVAEIKLLSPGERREINPERQGDAEARGGVLDQISQFLSRERRGDEAEVRKDVKADTRAKRESEEGEEAERGDLETKEEAEDPSEPTKPSVSSAEAAFDAFKAFFTPKPLRKDPAEKVDLEAVRRKIRADKDALRALFERTSNKTTETKDSADCQVGDVFG